MKKIFSTILSLTLMLSLCSCGSKNTASDSNESYSGAASIVNSAIEITESVQDSASTSEPEIVTTNEPETIISE